MAQDTTKSLTCNWRNMMQLLKTLRIAGLFALATSSLSVLAADSPATVPASLQGTYSMTFDAQSNTAPFKEGERMTVVVMPNNQICIAGLLLSNPVIRNGNPHEAIWIHAASKIEAALSSLVTGFNEINVQQGVLGTASFIQHGQLRGQKTSSSTTCSATPPPLTISANAQAMLDLAAQIYPTLFTNGGPLATTEGYVYRFFRDSGIYIGIKDDNVYTLGGPFGNVITNKGSVAVVLKWLQDTKIRLDQQNNNPPAAGGLYNLKITGFVQAGGISMAVPNVETTGVPAPRPSQREVFEETIKTGFGVSAIANYKITVINDTASRVTYRVEFSVTGPMSMIYDLTYDYTR